MKAKRKKPTVVAQEHGSPLLTQHVPVVVDETMAAGITRARVKHECRLDWYLDKCSITDRQYDAGIKFRTKFFVAVASTHVTSGYGNRISGSVEFSAAQLDARRWLRRVRDLMNEYNFGVLYRVCGDDEWASGDLPILRFALDEIADMERMPRAS